MFELAIACFAVALIFIISEALIERYNRRNFWKDFDKHERDLHMKHMDRVNRGMK